MSEVIHHSCRKSDMLKKAIRKENENQFENFIYPGAVFPISAKKCEKCEIFSGIFSLKFCKFRRFFSRQKPAFLFPAKNLRQLRFTAPRSGMSQKLQRKVAKLRRRAFFFYFGEQRKNGEKNASIGVMIFFFFFFFFEITFKPDKK